MGKWVLWAAGVHHWSTASDNYHEAMRLALRHFGLRDDVLYKDDKIVQNRWLAFIKARHDGASLVHASPTRGDGKTIPNPDEGRKIVGWRVGDHRFNSEYDAKRYVIQTHLHISYVGWIKDDVAQALYTNIVTSMNWANTPPIVEPVYEEPKSTYVTRESAEAAINSIYFNGTRASEAIAMLEDKPRERVKAGK